MRLSNVLRTNQSSFSIYIHWPYCQSKCTYCNFNKYVNPKDPPYDRLAKAMATELNWYLNQPKYQLQHRRLHSVYFGGGTPSLAKPSVMATLLETIQRFVHIGHDTEITAEFNPTSVEMTKLRAFRDVGINRLSLGIQSFDSNDLKILGRDHSGKEALDALLMAKDVFTKERVSFDLIYARPGQTLEAWRKELKQALDIAGDHLSMYQLSLEKSTPLHKQTLKRLVPTMPNSDKAADMYEETVNMAQEHGFAHYEVSSYARTQKAISRHNFAYWQGMDFLGIGPGAHGRLTDNQQRIRTFGEFHPEKYMALCEAEGEGIRKCQPISSQDMMEELIVFGMRTRMGIPRSRFMSMTNGKNLDDFLDQEALALFVKAGFLIDESSLTKDMEHYIPKELLHEWSQGGIRPTESGLARIDSILPRLIKFI
ncbi:putative oxygen-independent coproporphyrinogen III oxidase [Gilbertella persicaria]|uniref:putative oxygen-independent coproporphyrinogen III oxidase n=1 Tax=Gilbertella persicaria TaxID=101096 RepID=UPI00221FC6F1|nr:putative oxygen-independent coproporphyrinogen III oxidase [Gilbertella persicaria]KAI8082681.1 putative oxygen-independent coproporphyrinogen III oxidase [Gilbertella persicaria]